MQRLSVFRKLYLGSLCVIFTALLLTMLGEKLFATMGYRTALPTPSQSLAFWLGLFVILAIGMGVFTSSRISRPLNEMRRGAERFAAGDFTHRLAIPDTLELGSLAATLNPWRPSWQRRSVW